MSDEVRFHVGNMQWSAPCERLAIHIDDGTCVVRVGTDAGYTLGARAIIVRRVGDETVRLWSGTVTDAKLVGEYVLLTIGAEV